MKTKEELKSIKEEVETLNAKLKELTADELEQVAGGDYWDCSAILSKNNNTQIIRGKKPIHNQI